jgi:hypothetical protein
VRLAGLFFLPMCVGLFLLAGYLPGHHRAGLFTGPCSGRATGQGGGPGTARCLGPCRARAGPKHRAADRADGLRAAWPCILVVNSMLADSQGVAQV